MKIKITDIAKEQLLKALSSREDNKPLRIYIASFGWGGPSFGLALDEPKEDDVKYEVDDFTFVMEEHIDETFNSFTIDYSNSWIRRGFSVIPDRNVSTC
mgnify:CR=1 FL=1